MITRPFDTIILHTIAFYSHHISPRKGWRCAHSVLHGGVGCSGAAALFIQENGWRSAIPLVKERFRACENAARELQATSQAETSRKKRNRRAVRGDWCSSFDCCWCCNASVNCGSGDVGCCDCTTGD